MRISALIKMNPMDTDGHVEAAPLLSNDDEKVLDRMLLRSMRETSQHYRFETPWFRCKGLCLFLIAQSILLSLFTTTIFLWMHYSEHPGELVYCKIALTGLA